MNPPPLMKLVEIVRGMATDDEVFDTIKALAERYLNTTTYHVDFVSVHEGEEFSRSYIATLHNSWIM